MSIIAISYYLLGIMKMVLDGMGGFGEDFHAPKWSVAAAAPLAILLVWFAVQRVKNSLTSESLTQADEMMTPDDQFGIC